METPIFIIKTVMEKEDYKKFLYTATFFRNNYVIPLIGFISLLGALLAGWINNMLTPLAIIMIWIFMFLFSIAAVCFKVERKNKQRLKTDKTGAFGSEAVLTFYDDQMVMETPSIKATGTLAYNQFYQLLESKDYFIFYLNATQASLVRKKDIISVDEFRAFIIEKFDGKYKILKNF